MKSKQSNTSNQLNWSSSLEELFPKGLTKTAQSLVDVGYTQLHDLLWLLPLKIQELPGPLNFSASKDSFLFCGRGKILSKYSTPNFKARGKRGATLLNITVVIKDLYSNETINLKWFNSYSSVAKKIESLEFIEFFGTIQIFQGQKQIINPETVSITGCEELPKDNERIKKFKIKYPTINSVGSTQIKKILEKIPKNLWQSIPEYLPEEIRDNRSLPTLSKSFRIIHAQHTDDEKWSLELQDEAKKRLIYEEFFQEQVKIHIRRSSLKKPQGQVLNTNSKDLEDFSTYFPYLLTKDQIKVLNEIQNDFSSGAPMMRLIQGDVGCGKTAVAIITALFAIKNKKQAALMCPTESLAFQHFKEVNQLLIGTDFKTALLLGSTPAKEKKELLLKLISGEIDFVIGTHSLIQDTVLFYDLGVAIIDEQHKFGVTQRQKLVQKSKGTHCLIMTATPIPRSLSLTQFGDLDISTIKTMPSGRKGHKTRIIKPDNFKNFLTFVNTRLSMKEQIYVVVPAINESTKQEVLHLQKVKDKFSQFFPSYKVEGLHGQMKSNEKMEKFLEFKNHKIDILIATSVIEVGISVTNATVIAIMNPERFGLSSLHQLRGRVGRGEKPGFCFLVNDKEISHESMQRLKVIEDCSDGFDIAEEDLKIRGEGDLFGPSQSGSINSRKLANIVIHQPILLQTKEDIQMLLKNEHPLILSLIEHFSTDQKIYSTI